MRTSTVIRTQPRTLSVMLCGDASGIIMHRRAEAQPDYVFRGNSSHSKITIDKL